MRASPLEDQRLGPGVEVGEPGQEPGEARHRAGWRVLGVAPGSHLQEHAEGIGEDQRVLVVVQKMANRGEELRF